MLRKYKDKFHCEYKNNNIIIILIYIKYVCI